MTFDEWSKRWSMQMAKAPHWTKRPGMPITSARAEEIALLGPHALRTLLAVMTDDELAGFMLYFHLGLITFLQDKASEQTGPEKIL